MRDRSSTHYSKFDGFLCKVKRLCVPMSFWIKLSMREAHNGGLMGHFGIEKTRVILEEQFYWLKIIKMLSEIVVNVLNVDVLSHAYVTIVYTLHSPPLKYLG